MPKVEDTPPASIDPKIGVMRCLRCRSYLQRSGHEPHRLECSGCGQNYYAVMQLVPIEAPLPLLPEVPHVERDKGSG